MIDVIHFNALSFEAPAALSVHAAQELLEPAGDMRPTSTLIDAFTTRPVRTPLENYSKQFTN